MRFNAVTTGLFPGAEQAAPMPVCWVNPRSSTRCWVRPCAQWEKRMVGFSPAGCQLKISPG